MPTNLASLESTLADRRARYGEFEDVADTGFKIRTAIAERRNKFAPVQEEALHMIANKLARIANGDPNCHDSWHDIAGYATLVAQTLEPEAE